MSFSKAERVKYSTKVIVERSTGGIMVSNVGVSILLLLIGVKRECKEIARSVTSGAWQVLGYRAA